MSSDPRRNMNEHQFGLSSSEQAEITGRALGAHLWDQVTALHGGEEAMRQDYVNEAWNDAANRGFPIDNLKEQGSFNGDEGDSYPVFHHQDESRGLEFRYPVGGPYMDVHTSGSSVADDVIHMGDKEDRNYSEAMRRIREYGSEE